MAQEKEFVTKKDLEETEDRLGEMTNRAVGGVQKQIDNLHAYLKENVPTKLDFQDFRDEMRGYFTELKNMQKQTIADEAINTLAIAELREELVRVKRHVGMKDKSSTTSF